MKSLSLLLFLFSLSICGHSQVSKIIHQLSGIDGNWINYKQTEYLYDDSGKELEKRISDFDTTSMSWQTILVDLKKYNNRDLLAEKITLSLDSFNDLNIYSKYTYHYDENGCKIEENYWRKNYSPYGEYIKHYKNILAVGADCRIDTNFFIKRYLSLDSTETLTQREFTEYIYDDERNLIYENYGEEFESNLWHVRENGRVTGYDQSGNIILHIDSLIDIGPEKTTYTYNDIGYEVSGELHGWWNNTWNFKAKRLTEYEYDNRGNIIRKTALYYDEELGFPTSSSDKFYEYYCDNKLRTEFNLNSYKKIYEYDNPTDCFEFPESGIDALIFPNPAHEIVRIFSKAFQSGDIIVSIYDSKGSMVFQKDMKGRSEILEVDVREFSNGIYFVNLTGSGETITVKLYVK